MAQRSRNGTVSVQTFDPGTAWTLPEARQLLHDGYDVAQVQRLTGWPKAMLTAANASR